MVQLPFPLKLNLAALCCYAHLDEQEVPLTMWKGFPREHFSGVEYAPEGHSGLAAAVLDNLENPLTPNSAVTAQELWYRSMHGPFLFVS